MTAPPIFVDANGDANNLDASLWGELQYYVDLSMIYAKLPLGPFFCLRRVCKEWNHLASDRQFLEQNFKPPFSSNPYFILPCVNDGRHALLTFKGSSWSFTPLPRMQYEVSGLLFDDTHDTRVFDLHTRVFHTLPRHEDDFDNKKRLVGMMVDTSLIPYRFRVIICENYTRKMRVYDSNSGTWTVKMSNPFLNPYSFGSLATWGVHYNNSMYFRVENDRYWGDFLTYNLEKDKWNYFTIERPLGIGWTYEDIGIWKDRWVFIDVVYTRKNLEPASYSWNLVMWECMPKSEESPWKEFVCMPEDIYRWMGGLISYKHIKVCGEHVLIYNYMPHGKRVVLYNLDRKTWEKIVWPAP